MAEDILSKLLQDIAKEHQYFEAKIEVKAISSGGANYTSSLYLATISAQLKDDLKLFAKVAQFPENIRADTATKHVFEIEPFFYTNLAKSFEALEDKYKVPVEHRFVKPKFYGYDSTYLKETLVLEDLTARGFQCHDRMKGFDWEYASAAVEQMAKFHALSFAYQKEYPEDYKKYQIQYNLDILHESDQIRKFFESTITSCAGVIKEEYLDRMKAFIDPKNASEKAMELYKPKRRPTLVHGDYRASNLMHRKHNGKIEVVPIDYQTLHIGCPASDFIYLVFNGSDQHFRKLKYHDLTEHYYRQLSLALKRLNLDVDKIYPRTDFDADLKESQILGLIIGLSILSVVLVEEDQAPRLDEISGLDAFVTKPSKVYVERLNGIIEDFIRWELI